jgi:hypothetical protein
MSSTIPQRRRFLECADRFARKRESEAVADLVEAFGTMLANDIGSQVIIKVDGIGAFAIEPLPENREA